jgi:Xaa-Pro dipeptidase
LTLLLKETRFEGPSERAVEAELYRAARYEGAEDFRMLLAKPGPNSLTFRPAAEKPLKEDGEAVVYLAVERERYWAEAIRTFTFRAGSFVEERSGESSAAFVKLCKTLKPGVKVSDFYREALAGKGADILQSYAFGNGIGLGLNEAPFLREGNDEVLKRGMVFSLRTSVPGSGGYGLVGNTILVNDDGGSILNTERERPIE